ncbi:hypothetical protein SKAU_G00085790 [Synaphobranchus kaupii]|uniref:Uncharacterized protein n=1 Tax=Synaphobranchus kaupii TaxID=118154 RepID=A0A9Q1J5Y9_SYNKA|nr:hypothetical protein SKAU_G00085790 [Synaphobranchus kaupii]
MSRVMPHEHGEHPGLSPQQISERGNASATPSPRRKMSRQLFLTTAFSFRQADERQRNLPGDWREETAAGGLDSSREKGDLKVSAYKRDRASLTCSQGASHIHS